MSRREIFLSRAVTALEGYLTATSAIRPLPDFLIIGAQRSGTTALHRYLCQHPQVMPPLISKGVHYFDVAYDRSDAWYRGHFPARPYRRFREYRVGRQVLTGEASPYYLFHPHVPGRVESLLPDVRLIVLLREPSARALSHYHHERDGGFEPLSTFAEAVRAEPGRIGPDLERMTADPLSVGFNHQHFSYLSRGLYAEQIRRWLDHFPREQLMILNSESFFRRPAAAFERVLRFLDLKPAPDIAFQTYNALSYGAMDGAMREELSSFFRGPNEELIDLLGADFSWGAGHELSGPASGSIAPAPSPVEPALDADLSAAEHAASRDEDVATLARRSIMNFVGVAWFGLFSFLWLVIVTRGWGAARAGVLLEAVAFFTIATSVVALGSEESVVRSVSRALAKGEDRTVRRILLVALVPLFVLGSLAAVVVWLAAPELARLFGGSGEGETLVTYVRMFAPVLPITSIYFAVLAATRGYGTMVPTVLIERVSRTLAQAVLAAAVILFHLGTVAMALAWELPFVGGLLIAGVQLAKLSRHADPAPEAAPDKGTRAIASEFWRFSGLRGLASIFQVTSLWLDTLLVGALVSATAAAIYTTASRTVRLGSLVLLALIQAIAPQISDLFSRNERARAEQVYRTSTWWMMTLTWPIYLTIGLFAPLILRLFGRGFAAGSVVVGTMAVALLFSTAIGPVDMVLLMGGKSGWNLLNTLISLVLEVGLILVLVPHLGIEGAAIAWAASVFVNNLLPVIEVKILLGVTPFAPPGLIPAISALLCYGVLGLATRLLDGPTMAAAVTTLSIGTALYVFLLRTFGSSLEFGALWSVIRGRGRATVTDVA
jgi:O-antigen/teichoic acid export membrane protein